MVIILHNLHSHHLQSFIYQIINTFVDYIYFSWKILWIKEEVLNIKNTNKFFTLSFF